MYINLSKKRICLRFFFGLCFAMRFALHCLQNPVVQSREQCIKQKGMLLAMHQFLTPSTTAEAAQFLKEKLNLRIIAGGTDLIIALKDNPCDYLMDVKKIPELQSIQLTDANLEIGAAVTLNEMLESGLLTGWYEALGQSAASVGNVLLRNRATLVGNICNASPAGDTLPSCLVTNAFIKTIVFGASRSILLKDFFVGVRKNALAPGQMVSMVVIPKNEGVSVFRKKKRIRGHDIAQVSVAASYSKDGNLNIAYGSAAPTPLLLKMGTFRLPDFKSNKEMILEKALKSTAPISDVRSAKDYRTAMLKYLTNEVLDEIIEKQNVT